MELELLIKPVFRMDYNLRLFKYFLTCSGRVWRSSSHHGVSDCFNAILPSKSRLAHEI